MIYSCVSLPERGAFWRVGTVARGGMGTALLVSSYATRPCACMCKHISPKSLSKSCATESKDGLVM